MQIAPAVFIRMLVVVRSVFGVVCISKGSATVVDSQLDTITSRSSMNLMGVKSIASGLWFPLWKAGWGWFQRRKLVNINCLFGLT